MTLNVCVKDEERGGTVGDILHWVVNQKWISNGIPGLTRVSSNDDRVIRLRVAAVAYENVSIL